MLLNEHDLCCACYKLEFTSGPVQIKSMIVQVINSGSDVGESQFDLQIPGGGIEYYNECGSQWNASHDGWDPRYDGVGTREECYALPTEVRNACLFRFDWFRGADNATIRYSKIDCPLQLTRLSGCSP